MLYQAETNMDEPELALKMYCEVFPYHKDVIEYAGLLLSGIKRGRNVIDGLIEEKSERWRLDRIALVDKNILRIGVYEMPFSEDVPPLVAIDEAIELAKKYGSEQSGDFINGVLDGILRHHWSKAELKKDKGDRHEGR